MNPLLPVPLLLAGCGGLPWFPEDDPPAEKIRWQGYLIDGPYTGENAWVEDGSLVVEDLDGAELATGRTSADARGWWSVKVPRETPVAIRVSGEGLLPALWRATTPAQPAYWFTGSLFAYEAVFWTEYLLQMDGQGGVRIQDLGDEIAWLWGAPLDPEAWVGATVTVTDGAGQAATVLSWFVDCDEGDTGGESCVLTPSGADDPVEMFFAFNLSPGAVVLQATAADGRGLDVTYPARGGEVVSAWWLALPEEGAR